MGWALCAWRGVRRPTHFRHCTCRLAPHLLVAPTRSLAQLGLCSIPPPRIVPLGVVVDQSLFVVPGLVLHSQGVAWCVSTLEPNTTSLQIYKSSLVSIGTSRKTKKQAASQHKYIYIYIYVYGVIFPHEGFIQMIQAHMIVWFL